MKLLWRAKDGGSESLVWCWGAESKLLGSVLLLKFGCGSREAYHSHAFNSISWILKGALIECLMGCDDKFVYLASPWPIVTRRSTFHRVLGLGRATWVITLRGPWVDTWKEFLPKLGKFITLTHGRKEVEK